MNRWKSNKILKIVLTVTSFVMAGVTACSIAAVALIAGLNTYEYADKETMLEDLYDHYSRIYAVMAMANKESRMMQEELDKTNFRYGIIKDEDSGAEEVLDLGDIKISDPQSYEYCNFDMMPGKEALENGEFSAEKFVVGEGTRYHWDCSLFGYGSVYEQVSEEAYASAVVTKSVPIIGYYYNVADGIFYYETEEEFYRVDEVSLPVGIDGESLLFQYDSGQGAYYSLGREICLISDYYLTFDEFNDTARPWETWDNISLDGRNFRHTDIRFAEYENSASGEFLGKPIADHYYFFENAEEGMLAVRVEDGEDAEADQQKAEEVYWVIYQVRNPLQPTGIRNDFLGGDLYEQITFLANIAYTWRYIAVVILIIALILWGVSTVFVLIMAGHKGSMEMVEVPEGVSWQDGAAEDADGFRQGGISENAGSFGQKKIMPSTETEGNARPKESLYLSGAEDVDAEGAEAFWNRKRPVRKESRWVDAVKPGFYQKIPLDVETCIIAILCACVLMFSLEMSYYWPTMQMIALIILGCGISYILCFIWLVDFVIRVKLGKWWRSMLIYRCLAWFGRKISGKMKKAFRFLQENISFLWKAILILGGISLLEFCGILVTCYSPEAELSIWFLYRAATVVLILTGIVQADKLRKGAKNLADGNLQEKISTEKMFWEFKKHGENLNSINDGISLAVEKRMQSEHFRTELITNVSHDIKTPLTSIINYVDLLQKEELHNEKAEEYLEVLSRQSARLKKLTEDLIEASKASTGSMPVKMENLELGVFLTQTVGEFEEKLEASGLRVVMHKPEQEVFVNADGRHLWRVVENLIQNICKYAQPDTRVYIDLDDREKEAVISFKNISRYELNITGDELMERFVRGDASRHTEGSGLGLSIAGSLMELMHGKLEIVVDGDLFKVVLHFPK